MSLPSAVAIYARISSDQDGTALGVARQVEDCRMLAAQLGWQVAEEYVDNDISAYSGKRRPAFERMLVDISERRRDAVLVYHSDRLTRRSKDLERFLDVVTAAGVRHVRFAAGGDIDVANGDGLLILRVLAAVSENESAAKSRRVRRKLDANAAAGLPHGGTRPFGFEHDKVTHRPDEAQIIRTVVARFLAGEGMTSLTNWLHDEGVATVTGGQWTTSTLRTMLSSPRIAGLREHRGEVVGPAVWQPIISPAERDRILALMEARKVSGRRTPRRYLLSGLVRCHRCGGRMFSSRRMLNGRENRRYECRSGPDFGGCGGTMVTASGLEQLITDAVLYRLDTPELADALAGRAAADENTAAVAEAIAADRTQLDELAGLYAEREITAREWTQARNPIEARIKANERRLTQASGTEAIAGFIGKSDELRRQWADLNLTRQAAIVAAVVDHLVIGPGGPKARRLEPDRVDVRWRL